MSLNEGWFILGVAVTIAAIMVVVGIGFIIVDGRKDSVARAAEHTDLLDVERTRLGYERDRRGIELLNGSASILARMSVRRPLTVDELAAEERFAAIATRVGLATADEIEQGQLPPPITP